MLNILINLDPTILRFIGSQPPTFVQLLKIVIEHSPEPLNIIPVPLGLSILDIDPQRRQKHIGIPKPLKNIVLLDPLLLLQQPIHDRKRHTQELLTGQYVHRGEGVDQRADQDISEEVDCVGEDVRVLADEHQLVLEEGEGEDLQEGVQSED